MNEKQHTNEKILNNFHDLSCLQNIVSCGALVQPLSYVKDTYRYVNSNQRNLYQSKQINLFTRNIIILVESITCWII